jgi:hypothetical protein
LIASKNCSTQKLISQDELDTNKASLDALLGTVAVDKAAITNALLNPGVLPDSFAD